MPDLPYEFTSAQLPAQLPQTTALLRKTQGTLTVLHDVVQESSAAYWYEQGKLANEVENWAAAEHNFNKSVSLEPTHWRSLLQLAVLFSLRQQFENATAVLHRAYACRYIDFYLIFAKELSCLQWKGLQQKLTNYDQTLLRAFDTLLALSLVLCVQKEWKQARQVLESAERLKNEPSASWHRLSAMVWFYQKEYVKAIADCEISIELGLRNGWIYIELGCIKMSLVNTNELETISKEIECRVEAYCNFAQAIELDPRNVAAYLHRANLDCDSKHYYNALADCETAVSLEPSCYLTHQARGLAKHLLEDYEGALYDMNLSVELAPTEAQNYYWRGVVELKMCELKGAILDLSQAIKLDSEFEGAYAARAEAKSQMGFEISAKADWCRYRELRSKSA